MANDEEFTTSRRNVLRGSALAGGLALGSGLAAGGLNRAGATTADPAPIAEPDYSVAYWLLIDGIEGESTDVQHQGWIELEGFEFGASSSGKKASSGAGSGKVSLQDLHFTKLVDKSSPKLFLSCATGKHFDNATVSVRKSSDKTPYLVVKLDSILISSYHQGSTDGAAPVESVSLNFTKIKMDYKPQDPTGV